MPIRQVVRIVEFPTDMVMVNRFDLGDLIRMRDRTQMKLRQLEEPEEPLSQEAIVERRAFIKALKFVLGGGL